MTNSSLWPPERRAKQAAKIRDDKPWEKSTGPRTEGGKARSSQNAYQYSSRSAIRAIGRHAQIGERIIRLQIKRDGRKPFDLRAEPAKDRGLSEDEERELETLIEAQAETFRDMMKEINPAGGVDWSELNFPIGGAVLENSDE
jgi:hypothetical protein